MKVTVVPAGAQTSRHAIQRLLQDASSPTVVGVYRNLAKVPEDLKTHPKFQAVQGDLTDGGTLDFRGSDAVITLTPPKLDGSDFVAFGKAVSQNVRDAVQKSGTVKRVVYVSSMGAQHSHGTGEVRTNYACERILETSAPEVVFIRNCYFMENWSSAIDTINADPPHFYSTIGPMDYKLPMVSARDRGRISAEEALEAGTPLETNPRVFDLHGPRNYSVLDVKDAFEQVTGKQIEVRIIEQKDLKGFFSNFLAPSIVDDFIEMTQMFLPGGFLVDEMNDLSNAKRGDDTLIDALQPLWNAAKNK